MPVVFALDSDTVFPGFYKAGDPKPECSRCGLRIPAGSPFVRAEASNQPGEYRYHPKCVTCLPNVLFLSEN